MTRTRIGKTIGQTIAWLAPLLALVGCGSGAKLPACPAGTHCDDGAAAAAGGHAGGGTGGREGGAGGAPADDAHVQHDAGDDGGGADTRDAAPSDAPADGGSAEAGTDSAPGAVCGDGFVQAPEECDDGNRSDHDDCDNRCRKPSCGDGIVQTSAAR